MHRWLSLVCALAFVLCSWTSSAAYAADAFCIPAETQSLGHYEGDRDEVPDSKEGGAAHHHTGCSGHQAPAPSTIGKLPFPLGAVVVPVPADEQRSDGREPENQLRPPIA